MSVTLRTAVGDIPYVGVERADGEVDVLVAQRPEWTAARAYDTTTTAVGAGASVSYDVTTALQGCANISVSLIEMSQTWKITIQTRPHASAGWFEEAFVTGDALAALASARRGFAFDGPLGAYVQVTITNTSGSAATLKGVYVSGR